MPEAKSKDAQQAGTTKPKKMTARLAMIAAMSIIAAIVPVFVLFGLSKQSTLPGTISVSGRIDGYETRISTKIAGLITRIHCREGDHVSAGQLLVELEAGDVRAQLKQAEAEVERYRATAAMLNERRINVQEQIEEARSSKVQSEEESFGTITQAQYNIESLEKDAAAAAADVISMQSREKMAGLTARRYANLAAQGALTQEALDNAVTEAQALGKDVESKQSELHSIQRKISAARGAMVHAKASRFIPQQRHKLIMQLASRLKQNHFLEEAANASIKQALAKQEELSATLNYSRVKSPINGVVIARVQEPGAAVSPGQAILTLIDPEAVFLRGFVPDAQIGLVRIGQRARIFVDSSPNTPIAGTITEIDPHASFTPENIYFKKDRVKQVFGIRISINKPTGCAKLGMPADAEIQIDEVTK